MKKNIILESYRNLFFKSFDHTRIPKEYVQNMFDDAINSEFQDGVVVITGYKLLPSDCLKKCDPIAYKECFNNYCDSQNITQNDDGTYYDHSDDQLAQTHQDQDELVKECCHCCGAEYIKQQLNPQNGYCMTCQQDELLNGPKEFRVMPDDSQETIIIKQSCMKRWKKANRK